MFCLFGWLLLPLKKVQPVVEQEENFFMCCTPALHSLFLTQSTVASRRKCRLSLISIESL
jgi:hypothetical protein